MSDFNWGKMGVFAPSVQNFKWNAKGLAFRIPQTPTEEKAEACFCLSREAAAALKLNKGDRLLLHPENGKLYIYNVTGIPEVKKSKTVTFRANGTFSSKPILLGLNASLAWLNTADHNVDLVLEEYTDYPEGMNPVAAMVVVTDEQGNTAPTEEEDAADDAVLEEELESTF